MKRFILYHGSENIIEKPAFGKKSHNSDYGDGFYCTLDLTSAKEWASKNNVGGYANKYYLDARGLSIIDLTEYNVLNWIAILMHNRELDAPFKERYKPELDYLEKNYYIDVRKYDIVIGYRADDSYFIFPKMFVSSQLRVIKLEDIYKLGFLGKQIAIISEKAFSKLKYIESIKAEPIYKDKYRQRVESADAIFRSIALEERWKDGDRLIDLVKKNDKR